MLDAKRGDLLYLVLYHDMPDHTFFLHAAHGAVGNLMGPDRQSHPISGEGNYNYNGSCDI